MDKSTETALFAAMDDLFAAYARLSEDERAEFHASLKASGLTASEAGERIAGALHRIDDAGVSR